MKKILIAFMFVWATVVPIALTTPAASAVTCTDENKNIDDYWVAEAIGGDYNIRFRLHIDYTHCYSITQHYDTVYKYVGSVTMLGNKNCATVSKFKMNVGTLNGFNPGEWSWYCVDGAGSYSHTVPLDLAVGGSADDRCVAFNWTQDRPWYAGDINGTSPTGCLG